MNVARILSVFHLRRSKSRGVSTPSLMPEAEFKQLVHRERERSDRTDRRFSLAVFTFPSEAWTRESIRAFCSLLDARLRTIDEYGFLDERQIGILLPETDSTGARAAGKSIQAAYFDRCEIQLEFQLRAHPYIDHSNREQDSGRAGGSSTGPVSAAPSHDANYVSPISPLLLQGTLAWKRTMDIVGASIGLVLAAPILLVAGIAIKRGSSGPVIFSQLRSGKGGEPFRIYKLRTMGADADARKSELRSISEQDGPAFKLRDDPRVTTVGRFLRKTSIDELPQLWNVLMGDMSLVGPRPLPCDESNACTIWQQKRLDVKPGITCIWQVSGRSTVSFVEWIRMDLRYIRKCCVVFDVKLILKTVRAVIGRKGAC